MFSTTHERPKRWSLAARLTAWYTGSAFALILATTGFLYWAVVSTLEREDDQYLVDKATVLLASVRDGAVDEQEIRDEVMRESGARPVGQIFVRVLDSQGRTVAESPRMSDVLPPSKFPAAAQSSSGFSPVTELKSQNGQTFRVLAATAGRTSVHAAMDRTDEEALLESYRLYVVGALAVSLLVCAAAGYLVARHGLQPLREVTRAAQCVRSTTLHERLNAGELPAELSELATTFNAMLDRLEESFHRLDRFAADIAHELRTPVNNLRGEAEVALGHVRSVAEYQDVLSSALEECERLATMIDSLLFLARAESPQVEVLRQPLDLKLELTTILESFGASAEEAGISMDVHAPSNLVVEMDRTLFQRAVSNLVSNALAHTPQGGSITLSAQCDGGTVAVEVADTGCGIAPAHLPHLFDRFYRVDAARSSKSGSTGLGLAIVKSIATIHGGTCVIASELGKGTRVRFTIPLNHRAPAAANIAPKNAMYT